MSIVSIADSQCLHPLPRQERGSLPRQDTKQQIYVHEEVVGLLVLQLIEGHATEMIPVIDRLQRGLQARGTRNEIGDLRLLRRLAELDVAEARQQTNDSRASPESSTQLALDFGVRILPALRRLAVSDGNRAVSERLRHLMDIDLASFRPNAPIGTTPLSHRELQALSLAAHGMTNHEIAQRMDIREGTVKKHLSNVFAKLDVTNRTQAVDKGRQFGIL